MKDAAVAVRERCITDNQDRCSTTTWIGNSASNTRNEKKTSGNEMPLPKRKSTDDEEQQAKRKEKEEERTAA